MTRIQIPAPGPRPLGAHQFSQPIVRETTPPPVPTGGPGW
jgi:hypothetical protein